MARWRDPPPAYRPAPARSSCSDSAGSRASRVCRDTCPTGASPKYRPTTTGCSPGECPSRERSRGAYRPVPARTVHHAPPPAPAVRHRTPSGTRPRPPCTPGPCAYSPARGSSEHSQTLQGFESSGIHPGQPGDLPGMLTQIRCAKRLDAVTRKADRRAHMAEPAEPCMFDVHERAAFGQAGIVLHEVLDVLQNAGRNALGLQRFYRFPFGQAACPGCDIFAACQLAQPAPLCGSGDRDGDPSILACGRKHILAVAARIGVAGALWRRSELRVADCRPHLLHTYLVHRRIDMGTMAGLAPALQGGSGTGGHHVGNDDIAVRDTAGNHRVPIGPASEVCASRQCGTGPVHAPLLGQRTALTVHAAGYHHDARIALRQCFIVQPELRHGPRREILDDDIRPFDQWLEYFARLGAFHVQRETALGGVQMREPGLVVEVTGLRCRDLHVD